MNPNSVDIGDTVQHKTWGQGRVEQVSGRDPFIQFLVRFKTTKLWVTADSVKRVALKSESATETAATR